VYYGKGQILSSSARSGGRATMSDGGCADEPKVTNPQWPSGTIANGKDCLVKHSSLDVMELERQEMQSTLCRANCRPLEGEEARTAGRSKPSIPRQN
jgi:hypothetical protein